MTPTPSNTRSLSWGARSLKHWSTPGVWRYRGSFLRAATNTDLSKRQTNSSIRKHQCKYKVCVHFFIYTFVHTHAVKPHIWLCKHWMCAHLRKDRTWRVENCFVHQQIFQTFWLVITGKTCQDGIKIKEMHSSKVCVSWCTTGSCFCKFLQFLFI